MENKTKGIISLVLGLLALLSVLYYLFTFLNYPALGMAYLMVSNLFIIFTLPLSCVAIWLGNKAKKAEEKSGLYGFYLAISSIILFIVLLIYISI